MQSPFCRRKLVSQARDQLYDMAEDVKTRVIIIITKIQDDTCRHVNEVDWFDSEKPRKRATAFPQLPSACSLGETRLLMLQSVDDTPELVCGIAIITR